MKYKCINPVCDKTTKHPNSFCAECKRDIETLDNSEYPIQEQLRQLEHKPRNLADVFGIGRTK